VAVAAAVVVVVGGREGGGGGDLFGCNNLLLKYVYGP
jgi:hypothetical protein